MGPVHGLENHLRIPVRVVEDDNISSVQVDTETSPGAQHEYELGAVLRIVLLDLPVFVLMRSVSVNPAVLPSSEPAVVLYHVQHPGHLREDQQSAALLLQLGQQLVHHHHLGAILNPSSVVKGGSGSAPSNIYGWF